MLEYLSTQADSIMTTTFVVSMIGVAILSVVGAWLDDAQDPNGRY